MCQRIAKYTDGCVKVVPMSLSRRKLVHLMTAGAGTTFLTASAQTQPAGVSHEVAAFIVNTAYKDVPEDVRELGRKSILDGLGLALSGSVAESGRLSREYLSSLGAMKGEATIIGSSMKAPVRFAAFVNGIGIHADDYDDTQLAAAKDRVYGLLTHPTAPALPVD